MLIGTFRFPSNGWSRPGPGRPGRTFSGKKKKKRREKKGKRFPSKKKKEPAGRQSVSPRFQSELQIPALPNLDGDAGNYGEPEMLRVLPTSDDDDGDDDDDDSDNVGVIIYKQCWTAIARWLGGYVLIQLIIAL